MFAKRFDNVSGSAIREIFKVTARPEVISFAGGNPAPETFPLDEIKKITNSVLDTNAKNILQYATTEGYPPLIEAIIEQQKKENIIANIDEVQILAGSQQGIDFAAKALIDPGDVILVESPTFLGALQIFKMYEAKIVPVDTNENGIDIDDLTSKIKKYKPKLLYVIPTFQNPTGKTLNENGRKKIASLASEYNFFVLEDDPYHLLRYNGSPIKQIKSFDKTGNVIHLISFSKTVSPGLRVGAVIARKDILRKITICKQASDLHTSNLSQAIVAEFIASGYFYSHIETICSDYKIRKDATIDSIKTFFPNDVKVTNPEGGFFIWCELPEHMDAKTLWQKAIDQNVAFVPGEHFYTDGIGKNTFRLSFCTNGPEKIKTGIKTLGEIIKNN